MKKNIIYMWAFIAFVSAAVVACGNNGGGGSGVQNNPYVAPNCINCGVTTGEIFRANSSAQTSWGSSNTYNLIFSATQAQTNQFAQPMYYQTGIDPVNYYGGVTVQGQLTVNQSPWGYCTIPVGTYQVGTMSQGQWASATFNQIRVQLVGPATLNATLTGMVGAKGSQYWGYTWAEMPNPKTGVIYGQVIIESVNGQQCYLSISL